ncbi:MAG: thioesterase family protein [Acidisphaera sp.]|nr:thioesterase family protein [Acidisphaera sp.]
MLHEERVRAEWVDRNGHMNLAYFVVIFDHATDKLFDALGIGEAYTEASGNTMFVVETHTLYERELRQDELARVNTVVLGGDTKRLHFVHEMSRPDGSRAALQEIMTVHVSLTARRSAPFPAERRAAVAQAVAAQAGLERPHGVGRRIALPG